MTSESDAISRRRSDVVALAVIVFLGVALRLYHISTPSYDFLSWRETLGLMVARNFYETGMNLFVPEVDYRTISDTLTPGTLAGAELMVTPWLTALLYFIFGIKVWVGRAVSIAFALLAAALFYTLAKRYYGQRVALIAALILTVSPYFLYCGRCQMPEAFAFAMSFAALLTYDKWLSKRKTSDFLLAVLFTVLMLLGKSTLGVMALPMAFQTFNRLGWKTFRTWQVYAFAVWVVVPFALFMWWNSHVLGGRPGIAFEISWRFNHARWLTDPTYYTWIGGSIWLWALTPPICILGFLGLFIRPKNVEGYFVYAWLCGAAALFFIMPGATQTNGYYQLILAPPIAILAARALSVLDTSKVLRLTSIVVLIGSMAYSVYVARLLYRPVNLGHYACGTWLRANTPEDTLVLVADPNPTTLYFADRVGWTSFSIDSVNEPRFSHGRIDTIGQLGASVLAVPVEYFDNAYLREFNGIRDDLYDTYACYKDDKFTVFFLHQPAELALPVGGRVTFGNRESRIYLRGSWGPYQVEEGGGGFATLGPEKSAAIRFSSLRPPAAITLGLKSWAPQQRITASLNGRWIGSMDLPVSTRTVSMTLKDLPRTQADADLYTLTLEVTRQNPDRVAVALYSMDVTF